MGSVLRAGSVAVSPEKAAMYSAYSMSAAGILSGGRQGSMFSSGDALRLRTSRMRGAPFWEMRHYSGLDLHEWCDS